MSDISDVCERLRKFNDMSEAALKKPVTASDTSAKPVTEMKKQLHMQPNSCAETDAKRGVSDTVSPGDGWRLLERDEVIREGDEFYSRYGWTRTYRVGGRPDPQATYRRRETAPPCVETDATPSGSSGGPINRSAERQSPASDRRESQPPGVPQADNAKATGGRGQNTPQPHATPGEGSVLGRVRTPPISGPRP